MKKIDLHIHTQSCKQGDGKKREISPEDFVEKMRENSVEICAITNHNKFDIGEYRKIRELDDELTIFPGMEIDVTLYNGQHRHIIVIASPEKIQQFDNVFDEETRNYDNYIIDYKDFIAQIKSFLPTEIIVIPHFYSKDKQRGLTIEEANKLREDLDGYIIVLEPKNIQAMGIINSHNDLALFGSDVKDWNLYGEYILPEIKYKIDSFAKFYRLAENPALFIKTILEGTTHYEITKGDEERYPNLRKSIKIFEDINIIFGEKGAGKTIFVKNYVYPTLKDLGKNVFFHEGKDYNIEYDDIINELNDKVVIDEEKKSKIKETIRTLFDYSELNKYDGLEQIIKFRKSVLSNKNAERICKRDSRISVSINVEDITMVLSETDRNFKKINAVREINETVNRDSVNRKNLNDELKRLKQDVLKEANNHIKNAFSNKGIIHSVDSIKESIKKQTGSDSAPTHIKFSELVEKRLSRIKYNKLLEDLFKEIEDTKVNSLGKLPQKGEVQIESVIKVLPETEIFNSESIFDKNGLPARRALMKKFNHFDISTSFRRINQYFNASEKATEIDDFVNKVIKHSYQIFLIDENGNRKSYIPSEGEKAILSISAILENNQYDFYIFDEIERGLGNKYISSYLIPKIKELRDRGKTVIISTHNANIAINTLPSQTIYSSYDVVNEEPEFYVGNMYSNTLENSKSEKLKWEKVALLHLEGSEEMFSNRRDIYGI
ncbi:PHP N-terminal domain protein [Streptococcus sp. DD11]|uniref:PHP domain-containing protein n=1 Tax=Streptococcus sp. DD11 TaxID=1777879 RepID=UPI00079A8C69|nr:PHP domain-containing protein [Streptococcus sp. DD11]KXT77504.1 PHP N-terminal domain protein [Streptococcus sp. DD11]